MTIPPIKAAKKKIIDTIWNGEKNKKVLQHQTTLQWEDALIKIIHEAAPSSLNFGVDLVAKHQNDEINS